MDFLERAFLPMLLAWAVVWAGVAIIGLWIARPRSAWASFFFMSGLWAAIDAGIVGFALVSPPAGVESFRRLLLINAGLDVVYLAVGAVLISRRRPMLRGFGAAVLVQGAFLLVLDVGWWVYLAG